MGVLAQCAAGSRAAATIAATSAGPDSPTLPVTCPVQGLVSESSPGPLGARHSAPTRFCAVTRPRLKSKLAILYRLAGRVKAGVVHPHRYPSDREPIFCGLIGAARL